MELAGMNRKSVVVWSIMLMLLAVSSSVLAVNVCGEPFVMIDSQAEPVDIDCETGQIFVTNSTVNLLNGAHISEALLPGGAYLFAESGSIVNVYGGVIDTALDVGTVSTVTIYTASIEPIPGILEEGQTLITNGTGVLSFVLVGTYQDGTAFTIPCNLQSNAALSLNIQQTAPEIEVLPASGEHDFGDVEVGETATYVVQISNIGNTDLAVTSLALDPAGSPDFSITAAPELPFTVAPSETIVVDVEITYTPSAAGYASTTLSIGSTDDDEPLVTVTLGGMGIVLEIPPLQQVQAMLDFIDASITEGTLLPYGPGNSPDRRLCALKHMIHGAGTLIEAGYPEWAYEVLWSVSQKTDGERRPPDFVIGDAVPQLNQMVNDLLDDLAAVIE